RSRPVAVRLPSSFWYLSLRQDLQAVPGKEGYELRTLQYAYRIQRTPSIQDEAEVRFEYVSRELDPSASWCRHHIQFHRESRSGSPDFSLSKLHIPTGWVTIENVIRFLIADLGVPPLIDTNGMRCYERVKSNLENGLSGKCQGEAQYPFTF